MYEYQEEIEHLVDIVRELHWELANNTRETDQETADQLWADYGTLARTVCEEDWSGVRYLLRKDWDKRI